MKICFLGDAGSIHIRRWVEFFRDNNHQVSIISFRNAQIDGVDVRFIGTDINIDSSGGNVKYLKKIGVIKNIIREINPDIVNAHYLTSYGLLGAIIKDRPFVASTWGSDILVTPKRNIIYKKLTQYVLKKSDMVTSDSNFMSDEIENLGYDRIKVITSPMGIEIEDFDKIERTELENKVILSMRTLCDNSNIDIILRAFQKINIKYNNTKLIMTNSGDKEDVIKKLIIELGLEKNVDFLGFIDREKVISLLKKCSIYISIPTSDSTSVTLLEAMASGIFPIVSNLPANKEWINHGENGLVMKDFSAEELFEQIEQAIIDKDLLESSKKINKEIINKRAIWKENMNLIEQAYKRILNEKNIK